MDPWNSDRFIAVRAKRRQRRNQDGRLCTSPGIAGVDFVPLVLLDHITVPDSDGLIVLQRILVFRRAHRPGICSGRGGSQST